MSYNWTSTIISKEQTMKKITSSLIAGIAVLTVLASAVPSLAEDKEVTLTGEGKCAKCALHETEKCQTVIQTTEDGKTVNYYVEQNDVAKKFHKTVCQDTAKVTAKGTVKEVDGKKQFTATSLAA